MGFGVRVLGLYPLRPRRRVVSECISPVQKDTNIDSEGLSYFSVYCRNQFLQDFARVWRFEEQQPVWTTFPRWKIESHTMPTSGAVDRSVTPADKNENLRLSFVVLANFTGVAGNRRYE